MRKDQYKDLNYNFEDQKEPNVRMGESDFANLPPKEKIMKFPKNPHYRGGNINSFTADLPELTGIYENQRGK